MQTCWTLHMPIAVNQRHPAQWSQLSMLSNGRSLQLSKKDCNIWQILHQFYLVSESPSATIVVSACAVSSKAVSDRQWAPHECPAFGCPNCRCLTTRGLRSATCWATIADTWWSGPFRLQLPAVLASRCFSSSNVVQLRALPTLEYSTSES